jgi:hypothetical protein
MHGALSNQHINFRGECSMKELPLLALANELATITKMAVIISNIVQYPPKQANKQDNKFTHHQYME